MHVPLCQASLPCDSCAIYLIIRALFQVGEEPPPALELEVELRMLAALGLLFMLSKTSPPLERLCFWGFSRGPLWRLPLHALPSCITCTWVLPQAWGRHRRSGRPAACLSALLPTALHFPSSLLVYNPNTHPHPLTCLPPSLHSPPSPSGPQTIGSNRFQVAFWDN